MRIAHCVFEPPSGSGSGAQLRSHALNAALHHQGQVETHVVQAFFTSGKAHPARRPAFIVGALPEEVLAPIAAKIAAQRPGLVVVEGVYLADLAQRLIADGHRVVLDAHNVESVLLRQIDSARHGLWARVIRHRRWQRAADAERQLFGAVAGIWACSAQDAERIARLAPQAPQAQLVPNPVPQWCDSVTPAPDRPGVAALFVGHLGYRPNITAALRLARGIAAQIRARDAQAVLTVAGRSPDRRLRKALQTAQIRLVADPADLAPLYHGANMVLVPLTEGGGTRIKILEAMACHLPVVASGIAVEGLGLRPGVHFLQAGSDADFAACALRLSRDSALRQSLRQAAAEFVHAHHGPRALQTAVGHALRAVVTKQS
ncbi:MAG: glycosyltransferase family 4 protein [Pseudotabrizicola sp.]|uniref:glycosyltransferase family 4 protein n=1 Tax=Pseudotabrizicola sp. TaxID=2939647 RepID=UPI002726EAD7|nr:glycosyltransferase family 4 protein [Pseudotabrizicola sp.]MDO9640879.1 glycosyltransferase family 4 protein [Pseudotabrizicola sp.]